MDSVCEHTTWSPQEAAAQGLGYLVMLSSPLSLLVLFIAGNGIHSVITANHHNELIAPVARGPGGKLLPGTKRMLRTDSGGDGEQRPFSLLARRIFQYACALVIFTFLSNGSSIAIHVSKDHQKTDDIHEGWWPGHEPVVYVIGSAFLHLYFLITLLDWEASPTAIHFTTWCVALVLELLLLMSTIIKALVPHCVKEGNHSYLKKGPTTWDIGDILVGSLRVGVIMGMVFLYICLRPPSISKRLHFHNWRLCSDSASSVEQTPLLPNSELSSPLPTTSSASGYGSVAFEHHNGNKSGQDGLSQMPRQRKNISLANKDPSAMTTGTLASPQDSVALVRDEEAAFYRPTKLPHKSWYEYVRGYGLFFPYLWPKGNPVLQLLVLSCFLIMIAQRIVNIMVPLQIGKVIDAFHPDNQPRQSQMPWRELAWLIIYKLLQGTSGLLGSVRSLLWIPVSQYSYQTLTTASFEHVHSLSLDFHLGKRTGEVLSALNKGSAINSFMEQVTFQVFPMLFDLLFAVSYFYINYNIIYAELVAIITFYYLFITIRMASARADQRRDMVNADREEEAVKNDSITSYETVKYFNAEKYEFERYRNAIRDFQNFESKYLFGMSVMNICQSLVFMCGLLVAMILGAWEVANNIRQVGAFVTLLTYLQQLQGPLNFFGTFYRTVQQAMISAERLLELFKVQPSVVDDPDVQPLAKCDGKIQWKQVKFAYDTRKPALQDVSFKCSPGTTTAFVGESGGGKSTIFRLMYRYYNPSDGIIEIDGCDVRTITIDSVRRHIGVVPQDTILFNETIMYNLKYANQDASDKDVEAACRAAHIHERILAFPDGYDTKVGERGLRLSGGEKQRVAIARTLLKNPKIIMLDEATSALDSSTEQQIQRELQSIARGRTLLVIA